MAAMKNTAWRQLPALVSHGHRAIGGVGAGESEVIGEHRVLVAGEAAPTIGGSD